MAVAVVVKDDNVYVPSKLVYYYEEVLFDFHVFIYLTRV
jgi:hypothetical protein